MHNASVWIHLIFPVSWSKTLGPTILTYDRIALAWEVPVTPTDFWLVLFSGVVALSTVAYSILTWRLVNETRRMRVAQTEPMITINYHSRRESVHDIDLRIRNVGGGPAMEIQFEVEPDFKFLSGSMLSEIGLFKNGLNYLEPGGERRFFLTRLVGKPQVDLPFEIIATYRGTIGDEKTDRFTIDFSEMEGLVFSTRGKDRW